MEKEWFARWFDTPYYHTLYKNRNETEAKGFIANLLEHLQLQKGSRVLDLACGKGRHARTLHNMGYDVYGIDLSANSIEQATIHANTGLEFAVHDMRKVIPERSFHAVFNLFTSFGYFDNTTDNQNVLSSVHQMLVSKGILVIDFMNSFRAIQNLNPTEIKEVDGVVFNIARSYEHNFIIKDIRFNHGGEEHHYTERVQALMLDDFKSLLKTTEFEILRTFGNFELAPFDQETSDRLIIIAQKE